MDKAFLFDTSSKLYIATDSGPLDTQTYVICSEYIDLVGDFTQLYESVHAPHFLLVLPNSLFLFQPFLRHRSRA